MTDALHEIADKIKELNQNGLKTKTNSKPQILVAIVAWFKQNFSFYTFEDTDEIVYYSEDAGHYVYGGEPLIAGKVQSILELAELSEVASRYMVEEIAGQIRRSTYIKRDEFKENLDLLCLANGIFDSQTNEFSPHSSEYKFLSKFAVAYKPDAKCPEIDKFLEEILGKEKPLFYEITGATLRKENREQKAVVFVGEGANGKSTAISLVRALLGAENTTAVSLKELEEDRFAVANLYGKHANLVPDMESADLKGTAKFKAATGNDLMRAQNKNGHPFFFVSFAKWLLSCNKLPKTPDDMRAFYRRWIVLLFKANFEGREDRNILQKLTTPEELSGLLNMAISAYQKVYNTGQFSYDATSSEVRSLYLHLSDSATAFCEDMLQSSENEEGLQKEEVWFAYLRFCKEQHLVKVSEKKFWETLPEIFQVYIYRPSGNKPRCIRGIQYKTTKNIPINPINPTSAYSSKSSLERLEGGIKADVGFRGLDGFSLISIKLLQDIPAWVGADGITYGSYIAGQIIELPKTEADFLLNAGKAQPVGGVANG